MSDGTLFKPDKDFSKDADKILPEAESLAKVMFKDTASGLDADFWLGRPAEGYRQNPRARETSQTGMLLRRSHGFSTLTNNLGFRSCYNLEMSSRYRHTM